MICMKQPPKKRNWSPNERIVRARAKAIQNQWPNKDRHLADPVASAKAILKFSRETLIKLEQVGAIYRDLICEARHIVRWCYNPDQNYGVGLPLVCKAAGLDEDQVIEQLFKGISAETMNALMDGSTPCPKCGERH
jgi:hypothetical protein